MLFELVSGSHSRPFDRESRIQNVFWAELETIFFHFFPDGKRVNFRLVREWNLIRQLTLHRRGQQSVYQSHESLARLWFVAGLTTFCGSTHGSTPTLDGVHSAEISIAYTREKMSSQTTLILNKKSNFNQSLKAPLPKRLDSGKSKFPLFFHLLENHSPIFDIFLGDFFKPQVRWLSAGLFTENSKMMKVRFAKLPFFRFISRRLGQGIFKIIAHDHR